MTVTKLSAILERSVSYDGRGRTCQ
jgi:hypothetical protein